MISSSDISKGNPGFESMGNPESAAEEDQKPSRESQKSRSLSSTQECLLCMRAIMPKDFSSIIQKALYRRYCSSLNYYYSRDINKIMAGESGLALTNFKEAFVYEMNFEALKRFYTFYESLSKIEALTGGLQTNCEFAFLPRIHIEGAEMALERHFLIRRAVREKEKKKNLEKEIRRLSETQGTLSKPRSHLNLKLELDKLKPVEEKSQIVEPLHQSTVSNRLLVGLEDPSIRWNSSEQTKEQKKMKCEENQAVADSFKRESNPTNESAGKWSIVNTKTKKDFGANDGGSDWVKGIFEGNWQENSRGIWKSKNEGSDKIRAMEGFEMLEGSEELYKRKSTSKMESGSDKARSELPSFIVHEEEKNNENFMSNKPCQEEQTFFFEPECEPSRSFLQFGTGLLNELPSWKNSPEKNPQEPQRSKEKILLPRIQMTNDEIKDSWEEKRERTLSMQPASFKKSRVNLLKTSTNECLETKLPREDKGKIVRVVEEQNLLSLDQNEEIYKSEPKKLKEEPENNEGLCFLKKYIPKEPKNHAKNGFSRSIESKNMGKEIMSQKKIKENWKERPVNLENSSMIIVSKRDEATHGKDKPVRTKNSGSPNEYRSERLKNKSKDSTCKKEMPKNKEKENQTKRKVRHVRTGSAIEFSTKIKGAQEASNDGPALSKVNVLKPVSVKMTPELFLKEIEERNRKSAASKQKERKEESAERKCNAKICLSHLEAKELRVKSMRIGDELKSGERLNQISKSPKGPSHTVKKRKNPERMKMESQDEVVLDSGNEGEKMYRKLLECLGEKELNKKLEEIYKETTGKEPNGHEVKRKSVKKKRKIHKKTSSLPFNNTSFDKEFEMPVPINQERRKVSKEKGTSHHISNRSSFKADKSTHKTTSKNKKRTVSGSCLSQKPIREIKNPELGLLSSQLNSSTSLMIHPIQTNTESFNQYTLCTHANTQIKNPNIEKVSSLLSKEDSSSICGAIKRNGAGVSEPHPNFVSEHGTGLTGRNSSNTDKSKGEMEKVLSIQMKKPLSSSHTGSRSTSTYKMSAKQRLSIGVQSPKEAQKITRINLSKKSMEKSQITRESSTLMNYSRNKNMEQLFGSRIQDPNDTKSTSFYGSEMHSGKLIKNGYVEEIEDLKQRNGGKARAQGLPPKAERAGEEKSGNLFRKIKNTLMDAFLRQNESPGNIAKVLSPKGTKKPMSFPIQGQNSSKGHSRKLSNL